LDLRLVEREKVQAEHGNDGSHSGRAKQPLRAASPGQHHSDADGHGHIDSDADSKDRCLMSGQEGNPQTPGDECGGHEQQPPDHRCRDAMVGET
jgi:hypothetical protein